MPNQSKYRPLKELQGQLPLFFQPWWLDAVSKEWDIALYEENGIIKAMFPFQIEQKVGLKLLRNPPLCPYLGPFFLFNAETPQKQWKLEEEALEKMWPQFPKYHYFQLTTQPRFQSFLPFHQKGFSNSNLLTYILDLSLYEDKLFSKIQPRLRNYIKKAEGSLTIEIQEKPNLTLFLSWHKAAFEKKGKTYPLSLSLIQNIIDSAQLHESSLFQTAFDESGQPIAMLWTPFDNKTAYHLLAATSPQSQYNGALALLTWEAIKIMKQKQKQFYDFEGSMEKGIEHFFRKFGGERIAYLQFEKYHSLFWKLKKEFLG